jgi:DNA replication protein DnaC
MTSLTDLHALLKRLKLGGLAPTLPERLALARRDHLDYVAFLEMLLLDEVARRDQRGLNHRLERAGFDGVCRLDDFDWTAPLTVDRRMLDEVFSLRFLDNHDNVVFVGPVGVGKTFLVQALGYAAARGGHSVIFSRADALFKTFNQARADHSFDKTMRRYLVPDLLVVDDFGLRRLSSQESADLYALIVERHRHSSLAITSNRGIDEWLGLFDDPILGNSALDRLANASYQIVMEGPSYRARLAPHRRLDAMA